MPPKRRVRVRGKGKQKSCKSKESSSEEMERCTAEDIVTRLAKKYLLKSSTDTEHSDQKENNRSAPRVGDPYDADLETSEVDTAASVDTASDMECLDAQGITQVLSPSRRVNALTTCSTKGKANKSTTGALNQPHETMKGRLSKPETTTRLRSSRKSSTSTTPQNSNKGSSDDTARNEPSLRSDSRLFVSPFTNVRRRYLPRMNASDTSTPTSAVGDVRSDLNDSCFGFENLITPDPLAPISPVDHVSSPPSHQVLSRSSLGEVSAPGDNSKLDSYIVSPPAKRKVSSSLDLTSLVSDQQPAKRPRRKKQDPLIAVAEKDWAMKMAEQFEDIEMHELTIEG